VYGFWKVRVMRKHRRAASWRHLVPGALVATLAALGPAALIVPSAAPLAGAVAGCYAAAIVLASGRLAARHGPTLWPRIAAALVTLHVAYGAGFWKGVLVFGLRASPRPAIEWSQAAR
jgi:succinoglycan biosynthesis protein ExoA